MKKQKEIILGKITTIRLSQGLGILEERVQKYSEKTGQLIKPQPYKILTSLIS